MVTGNALTIVGSALALTVLTERACVAVCATLVPFVLTVVFITAELVIGHD